MCRFADVQNAVLTFNFDYKIEVGSPKRTND
jgi:hypothetical protein